MLRRGLSLQHQKNSPSSIFELREQKHQAASSSSRPGRGVGRSLSHHGGAGKDGGSVVRQRSWSSSASPRPSAAFLGATGHDAAPGAEVRRSNTTGKRFEGLKRRLGSLRRKPVADQA